MIKEKRDWASILGLSEKDKRLRIFNLCLMIGLCVATISFLIYFIATGDKNNRVMASITVALLFIAPYFIEQMIGRTFNGVLLLFYVLYLFLAGFLGCVLNFYNSTFLALNKWYDVFIHILAGYCFCFVGLYILAKVEDYKKLNFLTIVLFAFSFTLAVELVWELMERFADMALGQTAQGVKLEGYNAPLITDTMADLLCNFTGGLIFILHFYLDKKMKYNLGIDFMEDEIVNKRIIMKHDVFKVSKSDRENKLKVKLLLNEAEEENNSQENEVIEYEKKDAN